MFSKDSIIFIMSYISNYSLFLEMFAISHGILMLFEFCLQETQGPFLSSFVPYLGSFQSDKTLNV